MKRFQTRVVFFLSMIVWGMMVTAFADAQESPSQPPNTQKQLFLSLDEAINAALKNNLDIQVQKYNPAIKQEDITNAEAAFDTGVSAQSAQALNEPSSTKSPKYVTSIGTGLGKRFTTGTTYKLSLGTSRGDFGGAETSVTVTDPQTGNTQTVSVPIDNAYDTNVTLTLAQPLLKNRGTEVNTTPIVIAKKQREVSFSALRAQVINIVSQVKNTYWQLVFARGDLEAKRLALQLANDLVKINEAQVKVGTLAPIDVLQAKSAAAAREVDIISAEKTVRDNEDTLKQLLNIPETDPLWGAAIIPSDAPVSTQQPVSLNECLQAALENREELQQLRKSIEIQELSVNASQNQLLPQLDLQGNFGFTGDDTTWGNSVGNLFKLDAYAFSVGANFSYPLGNRAAKSALNKARLTLDQTRLSVQNLEKQITTLVRQAVRAVETSYRLVGSSKVALQLAEQQLDAEQKKYNEGLSTNFQVLSFQQSLASAQSRYTQALTGYNQSLVSLDQAIGMTLQRHNIVVNE